MTSPGVGEGRVKFGRLDGRVESFSWTWPTRGLYQGEWVVRVGGDDGELRPWHYIYVYSIESRLIMRVRYGVTPPRGRRRSTRPRPRASSAPCVFRVYGLWLYISGVVYLCNSCILYLHDSNKTVMCTLRWYMGTSIIRNSPPPPRITIGP